MNATNEVIAETKIDRTNWPPGPWDNEPDRIEFEHAGFPCLITRQALGHLCGYVAVPPGHKAHGRDYDALDVSVHGGLTYPPLWDACLRRSHTAPSTMRGEVCDLAEQLAAMDVS
jgi:hypothetical protein